MSMAVVGCDFDEAILYALKEVGREELKEEEDVFLWLPTGFGKSICYECLPLIFDYKLSRKGTSNRSTMLVISPLLS